MSNSSSSPLHTTRGNHQSQSKLADVVNQGIAETEDRQLIHMDITIDAKKNRTIRVAADQKAAIKR